METPPPLPALTGKNLSPNGRRKTGFSSLLLCAVALVIFFSAIVFVAVDGSSALVNHYMEASACSVFLLTGAALNAAWESRGSPLARQAMFCSLGLLILMIAGTVYGDMQIAKRRELRRRHAATLAKPVAPPLAP